MYLWSLQTRRWCILCDFVAESIQQAYLPIVGLNFVEFFPLESFMFWYVAALLV